LSILRDYYGASAALVQQPETPEYHTAAAGAGSSIVGMLEVIQSDFSKNLAEDTVAEDEAESQYEKMTQENKINKAMSEQDVKYNSAEATSLDKAISEHSSDKQGLQTEQSAVLEYSDKLNQMCIAQPEQYEERKGRREAEIAGLKDALQYLEAESGDSFVQKHKHGHGKSLRLTPVH